MYGLLYRHQAVGWACYKRVHPRGGEGRGGAGTGAGPATCGRGGCRLGQGQGVSGGRSAARVCGFEGFQTGKGGAGGDRNRLPSLRHTLCPNRSLMLSIPYKIMVGLHCTTTQP